MVVLAVILKISEFHLPRRRDLDGGNRRVGKRSSIGPVGKLQ